MNESERETPMTDAVIETVNAEQRDAPWLTHHSVMAKTLSDHARILERMCAELAKIASSPCPHMMCNCAKCKATEQALAKYTAMKEGKV